MTDPIQRGNALLKMTESSADHEALTSLRLLHQHLAKHGLVLEVRAAECFPPSPGVGAPAVDPIDRIVAGTEKIASAGERLTGVAARVMDIVGKASSLFPPDEPAPRRIRVPVGVKRKKKAEARRR